MSKAQAQRITIAFCRDYPGALELVYLFRQSTAALYGAQAAGVPVDMKGGYVARETEHAGRLYRGRVDVPLENVEGEHDLLETLRHEVLGHFGTNTFTPVEKRALLDGLVAARNERTLKPLWDAVNASYTDEPLDVRAEEVFALHCQGITPAHHQAVPDLAQRGLQSFTETCVARIRPMGADDLNAITCMVAQGLRDRSRAQQNFPRFNELFRQDARPAPRVAQNDAVVPPSRVDPFAVSAIQHVLDAERVEVHTAGRADLSSRASLQFVAHQAIACQRPGFASDGPEKYALPGGLAQQELDSLFRVTAGLQAERTLRESVRDWVQTGRRPAPGTVPPVLEKVMYLPINVPGMERIAEALRSGMARAFGESVSAQMAATSAAAQISASPGATSTGPAPRRA